MKRWLQRYDRWHDNLLEKAAPRGRKRAWSFPSRNHSLTENITYLSLMRHALAKSLLFVLTYSLIAVIGGFLVTFYFVATRFPHHSFRVQGKIVVSIVKLITKHMPQSIIGFVWEQFVVALLLFAFAFLLNEGTLRAWNRRAERLRMNPDIIASESVLTSDVWPPPPTGR